MDVRERAELPGTNRHRPRPTLLSAMATIAICGLMLGWFRLRIGREQARWRAESEALAAIRAQGGGVTAPATIPDWLAAIVGEAKNVESVSIDVPRLTKAGLQHVTDDILPPLKLLGNLKVLRLSHSHVTDAGMVDIAALSGLVELDLRDTRITDAALPRLAKLKALRNLALDDTPITDEGIMHLKGMQGLRRLDLHGTKVTPEGARALGLALPGLEIMGP